MKKCTKCGPGSRCKNCGNTTSHPYAQHHLEEIVVEELLEVEQEELLHDEIPREEYREESVDCDSEEDNNNLDGDVIDEYEEVDILNELQQNLILLFIHIHSFTFFVNS